MLSDKELKEINPKDNLNIRPEWDDYFLSMAFIVARRSFDPSSKCGCVIVSRDKRVLSVGYNGPIRGSVDEEIPLTRPERYKFMIHGEENALLAYNGAYQDIQNSIAYVTGCPCHRCLRMMIQKGITRIVYGKNDTKVVDKDDMDAQLIMLKHHPEVEIKELTNDGVKAIFVDTLDYIEMKDKVSSNF